MANGIDDINTPNKKPLDLGLSELGQLSSNGLTQGQSELPQDEALDFTPPVSRTDLFPTIDQPIGVGSSNGRTIFAAPGALAPLNIIATREQAAATRKKDSLTKLTNLNLGDAPTLKNPRFQKELNRQFLANMNRFIQRARTEHGPQWVDALKSDATAVGREFKQSKSNIQALALNSDIITGQITEMRKNITKGDIFVSKESAQLADDITFAIGRFEDGDSVDLLEVFDDFQGSITLDKHLRENIFPNFQSGITEDIVESTKDGITTYRTTRTKSARKQAKAAAERLFNGQFRDSGISKKEIEDRIMGKFADQITTKIKAVKAFAGKAKATKEETNERERRINLLVNAFITPGGEGEPTKETLRVVGSLVTGKVGKNKVIDAKLVKGDRIEESTIGEDNKLVSQPIPMNQKNRIELILDLGGGEKSEPFLIDLEDPKAVDIINGILSTSDSENLAIKSEEFGKPEKKNPESKKENSMTQVDFDAKAKAKGMTREQAELFFRQRNIPINITE